MYLAGGGDSSQRVCVVSFSQRQSPDSVHRSSHDTTDILGIKVSAVNLASASTEIARWIQEGLRQYVCVTGVHGIIESQSDSSLRRIHNAAGLVTPDGMPLVWLNWLRGKNNVNRVYGPDLILEICRRSEPVGWKHFFYGTTDETLAALTERLSSTFPKLVVVGTFSPPF